MLPASLNDDAGAEDQSHEENGVPQLLQILLRTHRGATQPHHQTLSSGPERNTERGGFLLPLLLHLDRRVGLSRADDALPLSIATSSRSTTAGPQRESGSLLGHNRSHCQLRATRGSQNTSKNLTRLSCRIVLYVIFAVA